MDALRSSMDQVLFGEVLLFAHEPPSELPGSIRFVRIPRLTSSRDYSEFMLGPIADHIRLPYCLVTQWDGFVVDAGAWDAAFLDYDYVGAPWPQFGDGHDVGNGGFSLRSKRLLEACRDERFVHAHPEDVAIGRVNRDLLERSHGIRFADRTAAARFSFERTTPPGPTFGFHGIFNMIRLFGADRFWRTYQTLDDRRTAFSDYALLARQLIGGRDGMRRVARLTADRWKSSGEA